MRVVVGAAILHEGRVLAAQRSRPPELAGLWEFPGGKVEPGESEGEALVRECQEELGVSVLVGDRLGGDLVIGDGSAVLRVWTCELVAGDPHPHDHSALRWLAVDELDAVPWIPVDAPLVQALRTELVRRGG